MIIFQFQVLSPENSVLAKGEFAKEEVSKSLFHYLKDHGTTLPHGCLGGSCSACIIEVQEGKDLFQSKSRIELETLESQKASLINKGFSLETIENCRLTCRMKFIDELLPNSYKVSLKYISRSI